jgi:hypothetical protein
MQQIQGIKLLEELTPTPSNKENKKGVKTRGSKTTRKTPSRNSTSLMTIHNGTSRMVKLQKAFLPIH